MEVNNNQPNSLEHKIESIEESQGGDIPEANQ